MSKTGIVEAEVKDHFLAHEIQQFYTRNAEATFPYNPRVCRSRPFASNRACSQQNKSYFKPYTSNSPADLAPTPDHDRFRYTLFHSQQSAK